MITKQTVFHARQHLAILALLIVISPAGMPALPGKAGTNNVIPLIVMKEVPLSRNNSVEPLINANLR